MFRFACILLHTHQMKESLGSSPIGRWMSYFCWPQNRWLNDSMFMPGQPVEDENNIDPLAEAVADGVGSPVKAQLQSDSCPSTRGHLPCYLRSQQRLLRPYAWGRMMLIIPGKKLLSANLVHDSKKRASLESETVNIRLYCK